MSRLSKFVKGITSPFADGGDARSGRERRQRVRSRRRKRYNSPETAEKGGDINRRVNVNDDVRDAVQGNAKTKPYDPVFLRDISANAVVQAYIDTLSQDVAAANWSIKPRDEDADISDEALAKVERHMRQLPPAQASFRDMLEATTRVLLELGDATLVKHYYEDSDEVAELVPVDSASLFKQVDRHGITEGFVQVSQSKGKKTDEFDVNDIVWVEWSSRPDRFYGQGPLEKAQNEVELLEELAEKERLDLMQGGPPGVLSPEALDDYGGLPNDEDWETFVESMRLDEGERHRVGYSKTPVNFEAINHNYQELQILDRSKYWVTVLGSVFKVNPSYAGFDFENVNRATDESQQGAYKQRGFRVTLRQLEEALNRAYVWPEISDDLAFEFEREQTADERQTRADVIEAQATAGKEMANAGRDVTFRDGKLVVEDGPIEEGDVGGGGGGGGLFGSVDDPDEADIRVDRSKGGVPLTYHVGGEAVDHESGDFERFLDDLADEGGVVFDVKRARNTDGGDVVYPPNPPETHDPHAEVFGVGPGTVQDLIDKYDGVNFDDIDFDAVEQGPTTKGDSGNGSDGDGDRDRLTKDEVAKLDTTLLRAFDRQIAPKSLDDIEKRAWAEDEDVPDFVMSALEDVVDRGAVFSDFASVPGRVATTIQDTLSDALTNPQGWSLDSIVDNLSDALPRADPDDLETIARTESAKVLNEAREEGYRDRGLDDAKFKWVGPDDSRTTDACEDLKDMTNPDHGGTPVTLPELIDAERNVHDEYFDNLSFRKHTIHPNERHTFVRVPGTGDDAPDVDVPSADDFADQFEAGDANVEPVEASKAHDETYADVVKRVAKATNPTRRMQELEDVLGNHVPNLLRECLEESGSKRGALREFNRRLVEADEYDVEERGKVSPNTLYDWIDRYDTHVNHLT